MKCPSCGNANLSRYNFLISALLMQENTIKCDQCNNLSKAKDLNLNFIRVTFLLFVVPTLGMLFTFFKLNYNGSALGVIAFTFFFFILAVLSTKLVKKEGSVDESKILISKPSEKAQSKLKFVALYISLIIFWSALLLLSGTLFYETLNLGYMIEGSLLFVMVPLFASILMYDAYPQQKAFLLKILSVKKYIVFILSLLFLADSLNVNFDDNSSQQFGILNQLFLFNIPVIIGMFCVMYIEKKIILEDNFKFKYKISLLILGALLVLFSVAASPDREEYYFDIERNGMTISNRVQYLLSHKILDEVEIAESLKEYEQSK